MAILMSLIIRVADWGNSSLTVAPLTPPAGLRFRSDMDREPVAA